MNNPVVTLIALMVGILIGAALSSKAAEPEKPNWGCLMHGTSYMGSSKPMQIEGCTVELRNELRAKVPKETK